MNATPTVQPWILLVAGLLLLALAAFFIYKNKKSKKSSYTDIALAIPETRRSDLIYGFYSSLTGTYEAVKDQVNLFWHSNFLDGGDEEFINILKSTNHKVVFDLARFLTVQKDVTPWYKELLMKLKIVKNKKKFKGVYNPEGETALRAYFQWLKDLGVLHKISYLYPKDEPNLFVLNPEEHLKMIQVTKRLRSEFSELANARIACIYGNGKPYWNLAEHDVVGVDDYGQKSQILTIGAHAKLVQEKAPHQRTMLIPGPSFGHKPDPWVAYALLNPEEVEMVIPFVWFDNVNHKDTAYTGLEAMPEDFKAQWKHAADICLNRA